VIGGAGVYNLDPQGADAAGLPTRTKFGVNGGVGLMFRATPVAGVFFESRFHEVVNGRGTEDMQFNNFTLGARFGIEDRLPAASAAPTEHVAPPLVTSGGATWCEVARPASRCSF